MTNDIQAAREAFYHVETALMAAQAYILGDTPEDMSQNDAKTETLLMVREALLTHLRVSRSIPAAAALLRANGHIVLIEGEDFIRQSPTCNGTGAATAPGGER